MTPVAVTRHIKRIETDLGIKPFDRLHQGVRLTDAGWELSDAISPAFAATNRGLECARQRSGQKTLLIGSETAFGKHWLAPRLPIFHVLYPSVSVDLRLQDDTEELDGVIEYDSRQRFGQDRHLLFTKIVFPVCTPAPIVETRLSLSRAIRRTTVCCTTTATTGDNVCAAPPVPEG